MTVKPVLLAVLSIILLTKACLALYCLHCTGVVQPRHCHTVRKCEQNEVCVVEKYRNSNGVDIYDVGCVPQHECPIHEHDDSNSCVDCCHGELCNSAGCGQNGYPAQIGPVCYHCSGSPCTQITVCPSSSVCMITESHGTQGGHITSGCESIQKCNALNSSSPGHTCSQCCSRNLCNMACTEPSRPPMTSTQPSAVTSTQPSTMTLTQPSTMTPTQSTTMTSTQPSTMTSTQPSTMTSTQSTTMTPTQSTTMTSTQPSTMTLTQSTTMTSTQPSTMTSTQSTTMTSTQPSTMPPTSMDTTVGSSRGTSDLTTKTTESTTLELSSPTTVSHVSTTVGAAQEFYGSRFLLLFPPHPTPGIVIIDIIVTTEDPVNVTLHKPSGDTNTRVVTPDNNAINIMDFDNRHLVTSGLETKGFLLECDKNVSVVINLVGDSLCWRRSFSPLPVDLLDTSYTITSLHRSGCESFISIVSMEENTDVQIIFNVTAPITVGHSLTPYSTGNSIRVGLARLETYTITGSTDFTGTQIRGNVNIGVVVGDSCSDARASKLASYLLPVSQWGVHAVVPALPQFAGMQSFVRILANAEPTDVKINDNLAQHIRSNESVDFHIQLDQGMAISSTRPIQTMLYINTSVSGVIEVVIPDMKTYIPEANFTLPNNPTLSYHVSIVMKAAELPFLRVDENFLQLSQAFLHRVSMDGEDYTLINIEMPKGLHKIHHALKHGIGVFITQTDKVCSSASNVYRVYQ